MSEGTRVLRDGKILCVSGNCRSREVFQEVAFSNRLNDVLMQHANCDDRHFL